MKQRQTQRTKYMPSNKGNDKEQKICHKTKTTTKNKIYARQQRQRQRAKGMP